MKVLVVEDNKTVSMIASRIINSMGHEAILATDGEQALALFKGDRYDLVLMDVELPGLDGFETTRRIRQLAPDSWFPIIFISGNTEDTYLATGIEAGGDDYLSKPVKPVVLKAKINAMARIAQMQEQLSATNKNLEVANEELQRLSCLDGLTSVVNRRGFDKQFKVEWGRCLRESTPLSVMMIDIDQFKGFNDNYGHLAGDDCLRIVAQTLGNQLLRPGDLIARYGGEEFAVLLPLTDLKGAQDVVDNMFDALNKANVPYPDSTVCDRVTISIGVFCTTQLALDFDKTDKLMLVQHADEALYVAKHSGRNQAVIYSDEFSKG
ncbi:MAG: diguanylate cyclase response regulator [Moraxellaceae bacterium]|nr:MAG: diguanylate cyclase response regulator [Moraxellaceae bacterium]